MNLNSREIISMRVLTEDRGFSSKCAVDKGISKKSEMR